MLTFEEEIDEYMARTGATIMFTRADGGIQCSITTGPQQSARRVTLHSTSPLVDHARDAFDIAKRRHMLQCAATRCVFREVHGQNG